MYVKIKVIRLWILYISNVKNHQQSLLQPLATCGVIRHSNRVCMIPYASQWSTSLLNAAQKFCPQWLDGFWDSNTGWSLLSPWTQAGFGRCLRRLPIPNSSSSSSSSSSCCCCCSCSCCCCCGSCSCCCCCGSCSCSSSRNCSSCYDYCSSGTIPTQFQLSFKFGKPKERFSAAFSLHNLAKPKESWKDKWQ